MYFYFNKMNSEPAKPWAVAEFKLYRPHLVEWVDKTIVPLLQDAFCQRVVIRAPVKSGKREIVEYTSMCDNVDDSRRVHAFLSAWHRAADEDQRKELGDHNMKVFSINKKTAAEECIKWVKAKVNLGKTIVIHLDECDHGSSDNQILGKVYKFVRGIPNVFTILYSATPQEVLFSKDVNTDDDGEDEMLDDMLYGTHVEYKPPIGYCGPGRFLDADLVFEAKPFFALEPLAALTPQGLEIITSLKASTASGSGRNIATLRLTKKEGRRKGGKEIYKFLQNSRHIPQLEGVQIWVDKSDCDWGSPRKIEWSSREYWRAIAKDIPILIVMDQTSSRSTEWACHDRIFAIHDYRTSQQYAILSQAQERVNHYDTKYIGGFQPIKIYGHKKTFELSAGRIGYEQYFACEWIMRKVDVRRQLGDVYDIKNSSTGVRHELYSVPLSKTQAEAALEALGCFGDLSLSNRVRGDIRPLPVFGTHWFQCNRDNWNTAITAVKSTVGDGLLAGHGFENPFLSARRPSPGDDGREFGQLRGWRILDYDTDIKKQPGWGVGLGAPRVTICYYGTTLGVAVRWHSGEFQNSNRLTAYRSMYPGKD